ncbi:MAG TPA: hypothetical protein VGC70_12675 [Burkholderiales bacterium]
MAAPLEGNGAQKPGIEAPFKRAPPADVRTRQRVYGSSHVKTVASSKPVDKTPDPLTAAPGSISRA